MDKSYAMKDTIFYVLSALLFFGWMVGYLIFNISGVFHLTFLLAVIVLLVKIMKDSTD